MPVNFIHLRTHSEYSIEDGIISPDQLASAVAKSKMPAVAITDINNCYALLKFYQSARAHGVKPILGCEVRIPNPRGLGEERSRYSELVLLVCDERGYHNLFELVSRMWHLVKEHHHEARMLREWFTPELSQGLIALSGGQYGDVGISLVNNAQEAKRGLDAWLDIFGDRFYLEIQRLGRAGEETYNNAALELARSANCPVVATNTVCFVDAADYDTHQARVCVSANRVLGEQEQGWYMHTQYLKNASEMSSLFKDLPETLQNSVEIAKRCNIQIELEHARLPRYLSLKKSESEKDMLMQEAESGLNQRLRTKDTDIDNTLYTQRLERELEAINRVGFAGYFLVVMDFVRWAHKQGIPVGPGRGSGAGSLVAWALNITDVDPLRYGLLFERFLNPERVSLPDFDIDFCRDRRDEVMDYVRTHYGDDKVAGIITFNRMAGKAAVRDATRVQGKPYGVGDRLSRVMPSIPGMSMGDMLLAEQQSGAITELTKLLKEDTEAQEVWDLAREMEGLARSVGRHAGGIVIAPDKLTRYSPLHYQSDSDFGSTHYDKDDIERVGLVKFDFLGLRTLTVIDKAVQNINRANPGMQEPLEVGRISLDDHEVYRLLSEAKTVALFQLESEGMRELLLRYQPTQFEDLIVLISLYRPGPLDMGMHTDYVERRKGRKSVDYYGVQALEAVLKETYGVFLYQEQVMEAAQVLANYSLGQADILRRAMGKKKHEEMAQQREQFVQGAAKNNLDQRTANSVFDVMEKFSGYGFNKSHAAAYALIAYRTAWLKTHYPSWFMAAEMSTLMNSTDSLEKLVRECKQLQLNISPPNINYSGSEFEVNQDGEIVYALTAIKEIGRNVAEIICHEREQHGPYKNLLDFCLRISKRTPCNQAMLEKLIGAGCFDMFDQPRAALVAQIERVLSVVTQRRSISENGVTDMFGKSKDAPEEDALCYVLEAGATKHWSTLEKLAHEQLALGFYMSGHPLDSYQNLLRRYECVPIKDLKSYTQQETVCIASSVFGLRKIRSNTMLLYLSDSTGVIELKLNPKLYDKYREYAVVGKILIIWARIAQSEYSTADHGLSCLPQRIEEVTDPPEEEAGATPATEQRAHVKHTVATHSQQGVITIHIHSAQCTMENVQATKQILDAAPKGECGMRIHYLHPCAEVDFNLQERVDPCDDLLTRLRAQWGKDAVHMESSH